MAYTLIPSFEVCNPPPNEHSRDGCTCHPLCTPSNLIRWGTYAIPLYTVPLFSILIYGKDGEYSEERSKRGRIAALSCGEPEWSYAECALRMASTANSRAVFAFLVANAAHDSGSLPVGFVCAHPSVGFVCARALVVGDLGQM